MDSHEKNSSDRLFAEIQPCIDFQFNDFLRKILESKQVGISHLYDLLQDLNYYAELESIRRYFNANKQSRRFPPKDFIKAFCKCLNLTNDQEKTLLILWSRTKILRKLERKTKLKD
jgi:hypothetical protein